MIYALVFLSTLLADIAWTRYTLAVTDRRAPLAAVWSAVIVMFGAFNIVQYAENWRTVIAAVLGAFVGTYWAVRRGKA